MYGLGRWFLYELLCFSGSGNLQYKLQNLKQICYFNNKLTRAGGDERTIKLRINERNNGQNDEW